MTNPTIGCPSGLRTALSVWLLRRQMTRFVTHQMEFLEGTPGGVKASGLVDYCIVLE